MAANSGIEWTQSTWNPVTGCSEISEGCKNCYAKRMALRLKAMGLPAYRNGFCITCHPNMLDLPLHWKKPQLVFVNSMSDLFHAKVPLDFISRVFDIMNRTSHIYQVLTKRAERLAELSSSLPWAKNIWAGVTVETLDYKDRIDLLRETNATVKFLSLEPLLEDIGTLDLTDIDWVIAGGESGPGARPMKADWVRNIREQCIEQQVPFFFKQWGGFNKKKRGRMLDGKIWDEIPDKTTAVAFSL
ncbi:MAG: phage Gp37/Gp68 family protein [Planctomycetota bacterium]